MKKFSRLLAAVLVIAMLLPTVAFAATGKVTTRNTTNLYNAYNSTSKAWNELKTAQHRLMGSFTAYCLQHKATVPNSETYNLTDLMDNYSTKVKNGLQIIVSNGYPHNYGGLTAAQAEYATANAIRFWLSECGDDQFYNMTNLGSFTNNKLRSLAAAGKITNKIAVRDTSYIPALQFSVELLILARAQVMMEHSIGLSASNVQATKSGSTFSGSSSVTLTNLNGGYTLDQSALPEGSTVTGYTGNSGDTLNISIPASQSTANQTYTLTLTGSDDRVRSNMQVFCHNTNQAYQRVLCVRLGTSWYQECATATLTVTTGNYEEPKPDLTIMALSAWQSSYETGATMNFTATVHNQDNAAAGASTISLSGEGFTVTETIPALEAGKSTTMHFSATAPATPQTLTVTAFADCNNVVAESNESNNKGDISVEIIAPMLYPDLIVSALEPSQATYPPDSTASVRVEITNQGEADAESFYVWLETGLQNWSSPMSLAAGESKSVTFSCDTASEPQTMTLTATADILDDVDESNENNNTASTSIEIVEEKYPDLTVTSVYPLKESYVAGESMVICAVIKNQGEADTGKFVVRLTPEGMDMQTQTVSGLKVGESTTIQWTITTPLLGQTEERSLTVWADSTKIIEESDENNNTGTGSVTIIGEKPDLTITSMTTDATQYSPGDTVTVTAIVKNNGIISCPASQLRLSGDGITAQTRSVTALAAGGSRSVIFQLTAPSIIGEKTYTILAYADPSDLIEEYNELNNTREGSFTVYNPLPDLTITQVVPNKAEYASGETGTVRVMVKNQGDIAVNDAKVQLVIGDFHTEVKLTGSLTPGMSKMVQFAFTAPVVEEYLQATITATADPANEIVEIDENNNTLSASIGIKPMLPDIGITGSNATNWYAGMDVVVTATVQNYSAKDVPSVAVRLTLDSRQYEESIPLPGNGTNIAVFRVTLPGTPGAATLQFDVDPYNVLPEENESNNDHVQNIQIVAKPTGTILDPDLADMETNFKRSGLKPLPSTANSDYHIWQEIRLEDEAYVTKTYWARLETTLTINPDPRIAYEDKPRQMESGFGVEAYLTTQVTTNYDHPEKLVGPQLAWLYAPESCYSQTAQWFNVFDSLEAYSGAAADKVIRWRLPVNPWSETDSRLHYTPLWFPDGEYIMLNQTGYAWTPAGQLYRYDTGNVDILGDMYDRVTAIQGR